MGNEQSKNNPDVFYNQANELWRDRRQRNQRFRQNGGRTRGPRRERDDNFGVGERDFNFAERLENQNDQNARPFYGNGMEPENDRHLEAAYHRPAERDYDDNRDFDGRPNHHREQNANYRGQREDFGHGFIRHNRRPRPPGNRGNTVNRPNQNRPRNFRQNNGHSRRHYHNENQRNEHGNVENRVSARPHDRQDSNDFVSDEDSEDIRRDDDHRGYHRRQDEEHRQHNFANRRPNSGHEEDGARIRAHNYRNALENAGNRPAGGRPNYIHEEDANGGGSEDDYQDHHNPYGAADNLPINGHGELPDDHYHPDQFDDHRQHHDAQLLQNQNPPYGRIFYESGLLIELTDGLGKIQLEGKTIYFNLKDFDERIANSLRDFLVVGLVVGVNYHCHDDEWCPIIIGPAVGAPATSVFPPGSNLLLEPSRDSSLDLEDKILECILNTFLESETYPTHPLTSFNLSTFRNWGLFICFGGNNLEFRREEIQNRTNMLKYIDDSKIGLQPPDVFNAVGALIGVLESRGGIMKVTKLYRSYIVLIPETLRKVLGEDDNFETFCKFLETHKWFFAVILDRKFVILRRNYTRFNYQPNVIQRPSLTRQYVREGRKKDGEYEVKMVAERDRQIRKGLKVQFVEQPFFDEYGAFKEDNKKGIDFNTARKFKMSSDKHSAVRHVVIGANHGLQFCYPDPDVDNIEQDDEQREKLLAEIRAEEGGEERPGPSRRYAPY